MISFIMDIGLNSFQYGILKILIFHLGLFQVWEFIGKYEANKRLKFLERFV